MNFKIQVKSISILTAITIIILVGILPKSILPNNYEFKFLLLPISAIFWLILLSINKVKLELYKYDLTWIFFVVLGFMSILWASNKQYAFHYSSVWLSYLFWIPILRSLIAEADAKRMYIAVSLFITVSVSLYLLSINNAPSFEKTSGYNLHYIAGLVLTLSPIVYFNISKKWVLNFLSLTIMTLIIFWITTFKGSRASMSLAILFFFLANIYWILNYLKETKTFSNASKKSAYFGIPILLGGIFYLIFYKYLLPRFNSEIINIETTERVVMLKNSFKLWLENPIFGVGMGNWNINAYKYGIHEFPNLHSEIGFKTSLAHNVFATQLSELGIIGFLLFILIIGIPIFKKNTQISSSFKASLALSILSYSILSCIYINPNFTTYKYSGLQFAFVFAIAILSGNKSSKKVNIPAFLLIPFFIIPIWKHLNYTSNKSLYSGIINNKKLENNEKLVQLVDTYNYWTFTNVGTSIMGLQIAENAEKSKNVSVAKLFYEEAIKSNPYHVPLISKYAEFLIRNDFEKSVNKVEELIDRGLEVNPMYLELLVLKSKLNGAKGEHQSAIENLSFYYIVENVIAQRQKRNISKYKKVLSKVSDLKIEHYLKYYQLSNKQVSPFVLEDEIINRLSYKITDLKSLPSEDEIITDTHLRIWSLFKTKLKSEKANIYILKNGKLVIETYPASSDQKNIIQVTVEPIIQEPKITIEIQYKFEGRPIYHKDLFSQITRRLNSSYRNRF
jgi:O-antigen ligase